jgi:hypothetical protein
MAGTYAVAKGWMHAFMRVVAAEQATGGLLQIK